ncbi:MAG: acetyl-CoA carboxylase biotin carboxylase subunit [Myxococcota bacterium]
MFRKVLVANRGEIAVRVMRTLREMNISPVAVYSEADRTALHVRMADEAYPIGPAPSAESYLVGERILDVCRRAGVDAIHPGYGFLSENAAFARSCKTAGVTFIGPEPEAMEAMGNKTAARERMIAAGVPVVPGTEAATAEKLKAAANELGYPVMLKASAGGGGKGMRLVHDPADLVSAYDRARSEAAKAFGDDTVYMEKAIVKPRHVEIQVLADQHGNAVHLFERDCSIQRRHQKVIEETPSPARHATDELISEMGETAVRAARAVSYHSAGTVEFLLAQDGSFYFLEMNTRLQVEHPITELITGMDLVRQQVRIAAGEKLGFQQADVGRQGHAIQCRIYAEDPATGFLPSPGPITLLRTPAGPGVRDDSGVYQGSEISMHYDPLLSKLCVWARTREQAIDRMRRALAEYVVAGIETNIGFHLAVMGEEAFRSGEYDTGYIDAHRSALLAAVPAPVDAIAVAAAVTQQAADERQRPATASRNAGELSAWRMGTLLR